MMPLRDAVLVNSRLRGPSSTTWLYLFAEFFLGAVFSAALALLGVVRTILPKPPRNLSGDVVLITGVTSPLGKCMAEAFARVGCTIVCVDSGLESVRKTADEVVSQYPVIEGVGPAHRKQDATVVLGKRVWAYECDLGNRNEIREVAERVMSDIGRVDALITCIGHPGLDIFDTVSTTLMSYYWTVVAFLPFMLQQERAHVVGVTPTTSTEDAYRGTRAAIAGLMESLGQEFSGRSGQINFITVAPKADPRLLRHSEEQVANDVVEAVRRDQCCLSANWWSTILYRISCAIHGVITHITRWLYTQGCDEPF
ncbi:short-chain dehydrogenase/reductase family 16C member 6-like [Diachasmimorpha longicaudata]|uniref:short-chain dehydrogenase/reductase family 16C member 6-like n=1 Tax=Diachasmimorpha longicaudata TaxID=58733 RepID=UPI0030B883E2